MRLIAGAALLAAALGSAGCMERVLVVDSHPTGARVFINGKDHGNTPQSIRYVHEGRFEIRLEKEGYESLAGEIVTPTRVDAVPGPDLVLENLPGPTRRVTSRTFEMKPLKSSPYTPEEMDAVLQQAQAFRQKAAASFTEAGTPTPSRPAQPPTSARSGPARPPAPTSAPTDALTPGGDGSAPSR